MYASLNFRYRYQLEAFVDKVRGRQPQAWPSESESIAQMKCVEDIYHSVSVQDYTQVGTPAGTDCVSEGRLTFEARIIIPTGVRPMSEAVYYTRSTVYALPFLPGSVWLFASAWHVLSPFGTPHSLRSFG